MNNYFYKTRSLAAFLLILLLLLNCSGCPNPNEEGGYLMPQKNENIELITTKVADDTAQIEKDGKIFQISGSWQSHGGQYLRIILENTSDNEFQFDVKNVKVESTSNENLLYVEAVDDTNVNLADDNPNNDKPTTIYSANSDWSNNANKSKKNTNAAMLIVPPKKTRTVTIYYGNFQKEENRLRAGSQAFVTVPTGENPADLIKILFNCEESSLLPI